MDFTLSDVQEDLRGLAERILSEQVTRERLKELEAGAEPVDRRVWAQMAEANLLGLCLPEQVGGSGYGIMEACVVLERIGAHVAPVPFLATVVMAAMPIAEFGTAEQRERYLPPVVEGTTILTAALQEPGNRDPLRPTTAATRTATGWALSGEKVAVPYGTLADSILVTASTAPGAVGVFVVDRHGEGVTLERAEATNREPQAYLTLSGAPVAEDASLGGPAAGVEMVRWIYERTVAGLCATAVGVFDEELSITAGYISQREQFGKPLATFQGATLKAADAYIDTEAIRVASWSAIWRLSEGRPASEELAVAKFWVADGGQRIAHACQHLHGGIGVDVDYPIHRYFLWAKALELTLGGATEQLARLGTSLAGAAG